MKKHQIDEILTLKIQALSHDGRAIAHPHEEPVVFVQGALPGQTVQAKVLYVKKRMTEAICVKILEESPQAVVCSCVHASQAHTHTSQDTALQAQDMLTCGACPWMGLAYSAQLQAKNKLLYDALTRIGHIPLDEIPSAELAPVISAYSGQNAEIFQELGPLSYRNKMEFAFAQHDGHTRLGLRAKYSHEIVEVDQCKMQSPDTMKILENVREHIKENSLPFLRFLVVRTFKPSDKNSERSSHIIVELITFPIDKEKQSFIRDLANSLMNMPQVDGFIHTSRKNNLDIAYGDTLRLKLGHGELIEYLDIPFYDAPVPFSMTHQSFFQVNTNMAEKLYKHVQELIQNIPLTKPIIWDIYCGVGGFTLAVAPLASQVLGIEILEPAIVCAKRNTKNIENCKFVATNANTLAKYFKQSKPDILILDPPRAGLDEKTLETLCKYQPNYIIMISCNTTTLARDLNKLYEHYQIEQMQVFDLFPHTPHAETVMLLKNRTITK